MLDNLDLYAEEEEDERKILLAMAAGAWGTTGEIKRAVPSMKGKSIQHVAAYLQCLRDQGLITNLGSRLHKTVCWMITEDGKAQAKGNPA
ncbi:MAG: hypothetical protein HQM04_06650 [Magnetococcales bacterium]|nr:hypothetical protein [Magnetococcales bacterium]MBF0114706.1 hypothetical protein [Magnetococcales bacterium]